MWIPSGRPLIDRALGLVVTLCLLVQPLLALGHLSLHRHSHGEARHDAALEASASHGHGDHHAHGLCHAHPGQAGEDAAGEPSAEAPTSSHRPHPAEDHLESKGVERALSGSDDGVTIPVALCAGAAPERLRSASVEDLSPVLHDAPPRAPTRSRAPSRAPPALP